MHDRVGLLQLFFNTIQTHLYLSIALVFVIKFKTIISQINASLALTVDKSLCKKGKKHMKR